MGAEDPGVVFTVKELIGRLDGKIDVVLQTLTNKADRTDLAILGDRVGRVESSVAELHERERAREEARTAARKAKEEVESKHRDNHRWVIGTLIASAAAIAAFVLIFVTYMGH